MTHQKSYWHLTCARNRVSRARIMKFVPPAKSVNLSSWKVAAIVKNTSCRVMVTMAQIAKWWSSSIWTAITDPYNLKRNMPP
jgi:hypothetical protein